MSISTFSQQLGLKAFPTAEGFGKYATGGRGGVVLKVTNLNDSGEGSLRQALQYTNGPRTIIFEVGGTINLNSVLPIKNGDVTIAGQTAPGGGILIKGGHILIESSNVILRHLRLRLGKANSGFNDSLSITAWNSDLIENIIIDHCSISWAEDENFEVRTVSAGTSRNVTLQNSIVSEAIYGVLLYGPKVYNTTFYNNLFAHNSQRSVESNYPSSGTFQFEMVNNIIYGFQWATGVAYGTKFAIINNIYKKSSQTEASGKVIEMNSLSPGVMEETNAYLTGNIIPNNMGLHTSGLTPYVTSAPFATTGIVPIPANQLELSILPHVGASLPVRDAVDERIIAQFKNGNGTVQTSGIYPTIQSGKAQVDTDNDGMPDTWELENGLNPNDETDRNNVQPDGYTNLEYYLNGMTLKVEGVTANAGTDVFICEGNNTKLTATGGSSYLWNTGETTASITVKPEATTTYTVTAYDSSGNNSDTDDVVVTVNPLPTVSAGPDVNLNLGEAITLTASGADSYLWSTGATTASIEVSPNSTTTYTVTGTTNNCEASDAVTVFSVEASVNANAGEDTIICQGSTATLTANGGTSYLWNTGATTASIEVSPIETTTYTVTAYDATGDKSDTDEVLVTVNPLPTVDAGKDVTINSGESVVLTATGTESFKWDTGATEASITVSPTATKTYTVTGTTNGCEVTDTIIVTVLNTTEITANAGKDQTICEGASATLTATGGTSYLWNTGATTASIEVSPIETTTYTVTAYDATGDKSDTDDVLVTVNPLPTVDAGKDVTINSGESVVLTATGTEFFKWDTGATEASITVSPTATKTYTVSGTTNGCEVTDTIIVTVLNTSEITANAGKDQTICEGASATLTATGGTSYLWNTGATTASIKVSPSETTTYTVTAYDAKGDKSDTDDVLVTVNPLPTVDAGKDVTINSGENITLTAIGTKTFKWDTGATEASITVSPSATKTYTVTGTTNGCEVTDTVTVTVLNSTQITADAGMDQTICEGASVTLTATGGDSFLWNTGATTPTIKVSPSQTTTYTVTVSDTSGNTSDTDDVVVTVNPLPTVDAGKNKVIKIGESITLTATGTQSYIWNTGATEASITVSPSTTTTYTVIGSTNGCDATDTITVRVQGSNEVVVDAGKDQSICEGGSVILTATGGETYLWNTGITTASIEVSPSETTTYTVTAYDSKGNPSDSDDVIVTVNPIPIVDAGKDVTINLGESVVLSATGSNNYQWSTGVSGPSINVSPTSTQTYTVTGTSNTCEATDSVTVTVLNTDTTAVKANAGLDQIICYGTSTTLTATGGDTYLWNTGETTSSINVSPTATTKFTVTAYKGDVSSTDEVVVYVDAKPNVTITNGAEAAILEGEFITLSATGADSYLWSNGATEPNIAVSPRATKTYSVTGTINNCEAQKSVVVNVFEKVVANAGSDVTLCRNEKTVLTADGPKNSSYLWSTGETTKSITVEPKNDTEYSVMVYHELDSDTDNVMVKVVNCNSPQGSGQSGQLVQTLEPSRELNDGLTELEFVVYPNPTYGDVNIKISGLTNLSSIHLYDLSGKALYNETINDGEVQSYTKTLDLSQYTSGIYLLQLVDDNRVVTKKIILK